MKTFEITFPNGERQIHDANFYIEKIEAGTKVLELYKTVSNYDSQSKPYLFITGYSEVNEVEDMNIYKNQILDNQNKKYTLHENRVYKYVNKDCCNSCKEGNECESKEQ